MGMTNTATAIRTETDRIKTAAERNTNTSDTTDANYATARTLYADARRNTDNAYAELDAARTTADYGAITNACTILSAALDAHKAAHLAHEAAYRDIRYTVDNATPTTHETTGPDCTRCGDTATSDTDTRNGNPLCHDCAIAYDYEQTPEGKAEALAEQQGDYTRDEL